jgi:hypothetical protein
MRKMSDRMTARDGDDGPVCAWCSGPLPASDDVLVIVHPADGSTVQTCSAACMAEWLNQGTVGLRRSIRRSLGDR